MIRVFQSRNKSCLIFLSYLFISLTIYIHQCESFDVGVELISIIVLLFICKKEQYTIIQVFFTLIGSKANSSNDNPCDK